MTKAIKFLITGDASSASKAFKGLSGDMQKAAKGSGFKGLGTDLAAAVKQGQGLKGIGGVLKNATAQAGGLRAIAGKAAIGVGAIGAAAVAAGAAIAIKFGADSVDTFKRVAGEVGKLKRVTGESAEDASRLAFSFKQTGVDVGAGTKAMQLFAKNVAKSAETDDNARAKAAAKADAIRDQISALEKAGPSTTGYADKMAGLNDKLAAATAASKMNVSAIGSLGIEYTDASGKVKPMADLMPQIADKFAAMPDGAEKTALAMKLFGKSGADMLPFLNKGAAGLAELSKKSDEFGNTLTDKQLQALKDSKQAQRDWDAAMQGLQVTLGANLLPLLTDGAKLINSVAIPAFQGMSKYITENQGTFDALGNMMKWVWNNILIPLIKVAIIGFAQMNKPIAQAVEGLGALTGNKDMETFGKGLVKAADDATAFADGLKGIPDEVAPVVKVDAAQPSAKVREIQAKIDSLKGKLVKAEAEGDTSKVEKLKDSIAKLEGKKVKAEAETSGGGALTDLKEKIGDVKGKTVTIKAEVEKGSVGTIKFVPGKGGGGKVIAVARGGILKRFAAGGLEDHSPNIYRPLDGTRIFNEPETRGEAYIPLANDWRRPRARAIWRQTGREIGMYAAGDLLGGRSVAGGAGINIHLTVNAAPGQQPLEVWRTCRDGLLSLKTSMGGKDLGLA